MKLTLTCIPRLVGCREPLSPDGPVAAEPDEHPVPVGGDGHVVRPPRAELRQARRGRVRAAVNLKFKSSLNGLNDHTSKWVHATFSLCL